MNAIKNEKESSRRYGYGTSKSAERTHSGKPGDVIQMSDRMYVVARDGSFRRAEVKS